MLTVSGTVLATYLAANRGLDQIRPLKYMLAAVTQILVVVNFVNALRQNMSMAADQTWDSIISSNDALMVGVTTSEFLSKLY